MKHNICPNFIFRMRAEQVPDFVSDVRAIRSQRDYLGVIAAYGIRRTDPRFWESIDLIQSELNAQKQQQSSDWAAAELSEAQQAYAASDVLHLHALRARLDTMLERAGRTDLAAASFSFLPMRAALDLAGWPDEDIFAH